MRVRKVFMSSKYFVFLFFLNAFQDSVFYTVNDKNDLFYARFCVQIRRVYADFPTHCLSKHVVGTWKIHIGNFYKSCFEAESDVSTLSKERYIKAHYFLSNIWKRKKLLKHKLSKSRLLSFCAYNSPYKSHDYTSILNELSNFKERTTYKVIFYENFTVKIYYDVKGRIEEEADEEGVWMMIYDEAFFIKVKKFKNEKGDDFKRVRKKTYLAPLKFTVDKSESKLCWSYCHTTLTGFIHIMYKGDKNILNNNFYQTECFLGHKENTNLEIATNVVPVIRETITNMNYNNNTLPDISKHVAEVSKDNPEELVYENKKYFSLDEYYSNENLKKEENAYMFIKNFDWSNSHDVKLRLNLHQVQNESLSVIPPIVSQGECGSCYEIATTRMLTARLWIKYSKHKDIFRKLVVNISQGLKCNAYNQGCNGGFFFLSMKFSSEFFLYTNECIQDYSNKYLHNRIPITEGINDEEDIDMCFNLFDLNFNHSDSLCKKEKKDLPSSCNYRVVVSDYGYIYNSTTKSNVMEIMNYIWNFGPVGASIEPSKEFFAYKRGLFNGNYETVIEKSLSSSWEKVDHAIMIVGWGWEKQKVRRKTVVGRVEKEAKEMPKGGKKNDQKYEKLVPQSLHWCSENCDSSNRESSFDSSNPAEEFKEVWVPYWKVENSWGKRWGQGGYAKIIRGINSMLLESNAIFADANLYFRNKLIVDSEHLAPNDRQTLNK